MVSQVISIHAQRSRTICSVDRDDWIGSQAADQMRSATVWERKQVCERKRYRWAVRSMPLSENTFLESQFFCRRGSLLRGNIQRLTLENLILGCDCRPKSFV